MLSSICPGFVLKPVQAEINRNNIVTNLFEFRNSTNLLLPMQNKRYMVKKSAFLILVMVIAANRHKAYAGEKDSVAVSTEKRIERIERKL